MCGIFLPSLLQVLLIPLPFPFPLRHYIAFVPRFAIASLCFACFFLLFLLVQFRFLLSFCATAVPKPMYNICSKCIAMGSLPSLPLHNPPPSPVECKEWPIHKGGEQGGHSQTDTPLHHNTFSLTSFQRFRSEHGPYRLIEYLL